MGKLKDSLMQLVKDLHGMEKAANESGEKFKQLSHQTFHFAQLTGAGIDETYLYIEQKIKKDKKKFADCKKKKISDYEDANVKKFIKGIEDGRKQALNFSGQWDSVSDDLAKKVVKLNKSAKTISDHIAKKRKKLFKSKKYKQKLTIYENWLGGLDKNIADISTTIKKLKHDNKAKGKDNINKILGKLNKNSTLEELDKLAGITVKNFVKQYEDVKKGSETTAREFRQAGDFKGELNLIKQWIADADGMDKEADDETVKA